MSIKGLMRLTLLDSSYEYWVDIYALQLTPGDGSEDSGRGMALVQMYEALSRPLFWKLCVGACRSIIQLSLAQPLENLTVATERGWESNILCPGYAFFMLSNLTTIASV